MLATRESTATTLCPPTVMESTTAHLPMETSLATTHPPRKNALTSKYTPCTPTTKPNEDQAANLFSPQQQVSGLPPEAIPLQGTSLHG